MMLHPNIALLETCYMGQITIDGYFATPHVTPLASAYPKKGVGIGYHIVMGWEIPMYQIIGGIQPNIE